MTNQEVSTLVNSLKARMLPPNRDWKNRFQIKSSTSSRLYTVAQRKSSGQWGCGCPGWIFHRHCKHLTALAPALVRIGK